MSTIFLQPNPVEIVARQPRRPAFNPMMLDRPDDSDSDMAMAIAMLQMLANQDTQRFQSSEASKDRAVQIQAMLAGNKLASDQMELNRQQVLDSINANKAMLQPMVEQGKASAELVSAQAKSLEDLTSRTGRAESRSIRAEDIAGLNFLSETEKTRLAGLIESQVGGKTIEQDRSLLKGAEAARQVTRFLSTAFPESLFTHDLSGTELDKLTKRLEKLRYMVSDQYGRLGSDELAKRQYATLVTENIQDISSQLDSLSADTWIPFEFEGTQQQYRDKIGSQLGDSLAIVSNDYTPGIENEIHLSQKEAQNRAMGQLLNITGKVQGRLNTAVVNNEDLTGLRPEISDLYGGFKVPQIKTNFQSVPVSSEYGNWYPTKASAVPTDKYFPKIVTQPVQQGPITIQKPITIAPPVANQGPMTQEEYMRQQIGAILGGM